LDTVVQKHIGMFCTEDEAGSNCFPEVVVDFISRLPGKRLEQSELGIVSHTRKQLQRLPGFEGQAAQLSHHKVDHVIGIAFGTDSRQIPAPLSSAMIE